MRTPRLALSFLAALPLALGALVALPMPAHAADTDVKINEVESQDGIPGDWVELKNTGATPVDISNYVLRDSTAANDFVIPGGTTIAAGGYATFDVSGLGDTDSARFFTPGNAAQLDILTWATPAATTWSRCPEGAGANVDTVGTKGLPNACSAVTAWPGSSTVSEVDIANSFGGDLSGLAYEGSGSTSPGTLWGVQNGNGQLRKITKTGGTWGFSETYTLHYLTGIGKPDAEGVTVTAAGAAGGVYVATERDGDNNGVSRPAILRFVPSGPSGALTATNDWDLTGDLPGLGANFGLEAVAWVPDSYLTAKGFKLDAGAVYDPAAFPSHGGGLFFVGVEETGEVIGYALNHADDTFVRVSTVARFMSTVTDLVFDPARQVLWAECDNNCGGRSTTLSVDTAAGPNQGHFVPGSQFERPSGMGNFNNEGFTIAAHSECVGGSVPVFWADDGNDNGHALRSGTMSCSGPTISGAASSSRARSAAGWYGAPVTVTFTCTPGSVPLAGACPAPVTLASSGGQQTVNRSVSDSLGASAQATVSGINIDLVAPAVKIKGVKKGKTYSGKQKPKCAGTDALSGIASCVIKQKKKGTKYKVTATATDNAGNVTVVTLTYKVKKQN